MRCTLAVVSVMLGLGSSLVDAQIRVNPTGVNVNVHGATTVFLTFGPLRDHVSAEAMWCGALIPATSGRGQMCDPATIFGRLPARYDLSRRSGATQTQFTDIMSIPPSVGRRAYKDAALGNTSTFFYVRRFVSPSGLPDEYVAVTCRLTGGGARTPFALTDVAINFEPEVPVLFVEPGSTPPPLQATITYTGTGRLVGRWEVVLPGDEMPAPSDLLTEATLPPEERGLQRRYTQLSRFNVFLPPNGRTVLPGPDVSRLPTNVEGTYLVLLRVEVTHDKEGDSNLGSVGGQGVVPSGAVAGFPLPTLRYVVGAGESRPIMEADSRALRLLLPREGASLGPDAALELSWIEERTAALYRVELETTEGSPVFSAIVQRGAGTYRVPPMVRGMAQGKLLRWRVIAIDAAGGQLRRSAWRRLQVN